jgi:hypothetical protein
MTMTAANKVPTIGDVLTKELFMADMAQIDGIISEINTLEEKEKIILFHKIEEIRDKQDDEEITLESAFGLWKDREITKGTLRKKAWKQN